MDNLTHTLVGLTAAELILRAFPEERRPARSYAWFLSALANNFPDFDILYAPYLSGKMSYLLHHRGHTHTFVAGIGQSVLVFLLGWAFAKLRKREISAIERNVWLLLCGLGPAIHIGLDYLNSYGVHPFWPFDNSWYYGDTLFIVEPVLWVTLIPPLFLAARDKIVRALLGALFAIGLGLCWFTPYLPMPHAIVLTIIAFLSAWVAQKGRNAVPWSLALTSLLVFFVVGKVVRAQVLETVQRAGVSVQDLVLSPLPANPFCWMLISVEREGETYRLRKGMAAPFPGAFPAERCPRIRMGEATMPRQPSSLPEDSRMLWTGQWEEKWSRLEELEKHHCGMAAFVRFARAPFITEIGNQMIIGDARYDTDSDLGFSEFVVSREPASLSCPAHVPPWQGSLFDHRARQN